MGKLKVHDKGMEDDRAQESAIEQTADIKRTQKGLLEGVKILDFYSTVHKRHYSPDACKKANFAVKVNIDHARPKDSSDLSKPVRSATERFGKIQNVRVTDKGVFGDLKYNPDHKFAKTFEWWADNEPEAIALSPDMILRGPYRDDGSREVKEIPRVFSVDIVSDGGCNKSLYEDATPEPAEAADVDMSNLDVDGDSEVNERVAALISALVMDSSLDNKSRREKVLLALDLLDEEEEVPEVPEVKTPEVKTSETDSGKESAELSKAEREELNALRAQESARKLESKAEDACKTAKLNEALVNKVFISQLTRAQESEWGEIIEDRKRLIVPSKETPQSSGRSGSPPTLEEALKNRS